jgi:hypothetical protein
MTDWLKTIQSVGRGFRPGMEIKMISAGSKTGKSVWMDFESDDFKPWRENMRPHYAEYRDFDTGETYWKKLNRLPSGPRLYTANNVIRHNEDGSYEYIKNRETGELRKLTEQEAMWLILKVGA